MPSYESQFTGKEIDERLGKIPDIESKVEELENNGTGKAGGYYVPFVDNDGDLSWNPTESAMPSVETKNIKGADGFSPVVEVTQYSNSITGKSGMTVTVQNKDGTFNSASVEDGKDGTDGKSAYQYAVAGGYTGTEEEFAELMASGTGGKEEVYIGDTEPTDENIKLFIDTSDEEKIPLSEFENDVGFITEAPQADWSQNDETAADFVKNRTHWAEDVDEVFIEEAVYLYSEDDGGILFLDKSLVVGDTYVIRWNDVDYECVPIIVTTEYGSITYFGNPVMIGGDDNGMPFSGGDAGDMIVFFAEEDTKIGVRHLYTKYHKLSSEFFPKPFLIPTTKLKVSNNNCLITASGDSTELAKYLLNDFPVFVEAIDEEGHQARYKIVGWITIYPMKLEKDCASDTPLFLFAHGMDITNNFRITINWNPID